ncbi:ferroxidase HEPHL1 [Bombina bombina]|uniref:ferroxidase HEPHL1 n=1 Tax=Bombina bombina TaxID=8345 RepID=UPI00235B2411|nr:ferroxidase HEPHL1 [Bombina bombina]
MLSVYVVSTIALQFLWPTLHPVECITRTYYIGIVEEAWDYAPSGKNLITDQNITDDHNSATFLERSTNRIGSVYKKAIYKQFSNGAYTEEIAKPAWLGFLGPIIKAEVEDKIVVHLKNFASRPYTLHPHGVFYKKDSEGAFYPDGTKNGDKKDDSVAPGGHHTYTWIVKPEYAPTSEDPNCLTWIYHSHTDAPKDIASGLIGALLTCKKGTLNSFSNRKDVDKDFVVMFSVVDENMSWYLDTNIHSYCSKPDTVDIEDEDFQESNKMHAVNGYLFGNLPALDMCLGDSVSWHLFGMGNEVDVHSAYFYGHTITNQGHRADVISLFPATFVTVEMKPSTVGTWMLSCQVNDHIQAGMMAFFNIGTCGKTLTSHMGGSVRKYFIAAEMTLWDYAPTGHNAFTGDLLNDSDSSAIFFTKQIDRIGGTYWKVHYTQYTDETFNVQIHASEAEKHLGILGPVIKAEVGDTIVIVFTNKADRDYSIMPHGVSFNKDSEGAGYADGFEKGGSHVGPGQSFRYTWKVTENEGPTNSDPNCLTYLYYSASDPVMDTNSGLVGPLLVCKKGSLNPDNTQIQVDKEFYLLFTVFDENLSWYLEKNINMISENPETIDKEDEDFMESNKMHAVNGFMYGNLPGLDLCRLDNVSWHLLGLGTEIDIHGVYFEGNTLHLGGLTRDTISLFPHTTITAYMQPDTVGRFEVSCRTTDHNIGGMKQLYKVSECSDSSPPETQYGVVRSYFIAAEEMEWDYSPDRTWELEKHDAVGQEHDSPGHIFVNTEEDRIGSKYKKVIYREYTDGQFSELKQRTQEEEHLEILGPFIRAEVGDSIVIVFKNKATRPYSVHAHGVVQVSRSNEKLTTHPGGTNIYRWNVPERSGPGPNDPDCLTWAYYSTEDVIMDLYSGLVGPLVTCRKGVLDPEGRRKDVAREFALLFLVFDENQSWYLEDNIQHYIHKDPSEVNRTEEFEESNKMHAINGKIYGNLHGLTMAEGEKTNWYLIGLGNEIDMHTVHFHAQSFTYKNDKEHRADVYDLFPGTFQTIELVAGNPGMWLLHCHVADHIHAGMETTFTVKERSEPDNVPPAGYPTGIPFLGKDLSGREAYIALISLLAIGLVLLALLLILLTVLSCARKRMYYSTIQNGSLPINNL